MKNILPNFFIVGAAKAGTTSLYYYLKQHPQIFLSKLKEPHYFSKINYDKCRGIIPFVEDWGSYLKLFKKVRSEKAIGEASVSYLCHQGTASRIAKKIPNAKIIIILRNPIDRIFSHFLMDIREGRLCSDSNFISTVLSDYQKTEKKIWGNSNLFIECGMYYEQVKDYLEVFGKDKVIVLMFEDFILSRKRVLDSVFKFLDVYLKDDINIDRQFNAFAIPKNSYFKKIYNNYRIRKIGSTIVPDKYKEIVKQIFIKRGNKPQIFNSNKKKLIELYKDDIKKTANLIGRDLSSWYSNE